MEQNKMDGLPEGWEKNELGKLLKVQNGYAFDAVNFSDTEGFPLIRIRDLKNSSTQLRYKGDWDEKFKVSNGDLLIGMDGEFRCYEWKGGHALLNQRVCRLQDINPGLSRKFLLYGINSHLQEIEEKTAFVTVKHISSKQINSIQFPLPPLPEQERIVAKLDGIFEHIDASIKLLEQNIADADAVAESINDEMFCSAEFESESLDSLVSIISGISLPSIFDKNWSNNGLIPFYKVAQMNNDPRRMKGAQLLFNEETSKREKIKVFPRGTVVFPKRGGAIFTNKKRILTEDASYDSNIMGLKANPEVLSDEYLLYFLNSVDFGAIVDDAGIPQINNKHIRGIKIPLPPLAEQERIVAKLDAFFAEQKAAKAKYESQITELKALKSSILSSAFRGEI